MGRPPFSRDVGRPPDTAVRSLTGGGDGDFGQLETIATVSAGGSSTVTVLSVGDGDPPLDLEFINLMIGQDPAGSNWQMDIIVRDEFGNLIFAFRQSGEKYPQQFPTAFAIPSGGALEATIYNDSSTQETVNVEGAAREVR